MPHLYNLTESYRNLISALENDEPSEDGLKNELTQITTQLSDKAESIAKMIIELESGNVIIQSEIDRLSNHKRVSENKVKWLRDYVLGEMLASGIDKIPGQLLTLSLQKVQPSVVVLNKDEVEERFRRIVPETWEVDKRGILDNFKVTAEIPKGCEIITDKKSLRIK
jgi:hypothetical protein